MGPRAWSAGWATPATRGSRGRLPSSTHTTRRPAGVSHAVWRTITVAYCLLCVTEPKFADRRRRGGFLCSQSSPSSNGRRPGRDPGASSAPASPPGPATRKRVGIRRDGGLVGRPPQHPPSSADRPAAVITTGMALTLLLTVHVVLSRFTDQPERNEAVPARRWNFPYTSIDARTRGGCCPVLIRPRGTHRRQRPGPRPALEPRD